MDRREEKVSEGLKLLLIYYHYFRIEMFELYTLGGMSISPI